MLNPRQWLLNLAPPPRKRVTVSAVLPLLIFLVVFVGGCVFVSLRHLVQFSNLAPFGLLVLSVWIWWLQTAGYSGLSGVAVNRRVARAFVSAGTFHSRAGRAAE